MYANDPRDLGLGPIEEDEREGRRAGEEDDAPARGRNLIDDLEEDDDA